MTNPNGQTPAQPTGKRQLHGATPISSESYEDKRASKRAVATADDEPVAGGVAAFPGEVVQEMKKVIWPTSRQMVNYTLVVFGFLIILTAFMSGTDWLGTRLVEWVLIR
ncbi:preprotein translocase subunit SecE [Corynebacterium sp. HMSC29G08]|uniref:preprotein translocase subunit SecE n=1 Tax=Corynebacterium sp. HMSC29G08 TaxID=1581069 RepID=UPI0008A4BC2C|nr:preprotein translocase subunit SecE [Corynebacterium sp. HMSC29G08]OFT81342.1 preprotein translocase subunit SecE [Corynebacterium sp. HMSC29G08]